MTKSLLLQILSLLVEAVLKQLLLKSHLIIKMILTIIIRVILTSDDDHQDNCDDDNHDQQTDENQINSKSRFCVTCLQKIDSMCFVNSTFIGHCYGHPIEG